MEILVDDQDRSHVILLRMLLVFLAVVYCAFIGFLGADLIDNKDFVLFRFAVELLITPCVSRTCEVFIDNLVSLNQLDGDGA